MLAPPKHSPVLLCREEVVGELVTDHACLLGPLQQETQLVAETFVGHILKALAAGCNDGVQRVRPRLLGPTEPAVQHVQPVLQYRRQQDEPADRGVEVLGLVPEQPQRHTKPVPVGLPGPPTPMPLAPKVLTLLRRPSTATTVEPSIT
jgi:hypothetical protein